VSAKGDGFVRFLKFVRQLLAAFRHVFTSGKSTTTRARKKAARPPRRCTECHQPVQHSEDWRDHLHT
jgi:hypothetical protein